MDSKLFRQGIAKITLGIVLMGALLFLPAGTFAYPQGWLLMGVLFIPMFLAGLVMMKKSPDLLRKRLNNKEEQSEQRVVILLSGLMFLAAFITAGLNFRFGAAAPDGQARFPWRVLPMGVSVGAAVVFMIAYAVYAEVLRENEYLSRTVEVQEGQHVVDTGLYGIVRHPMYMATIFLFLSMPLILGSLISFVITLAYLPIIAKRIRNEEQVLEEGLAGYREYKQRVRYKVIPGIW
jgi:protein-S-isoprenylcysteine O-methyltransferase Ste14